MTVSDNRPADRVRQRTLREDLLQDLRQTAPALESPPGGHRARATATPPTRARETTPTIELRFTPALWLVPSLWPLAGGLGMVLVAGPFAVSVDPFGR